MYDFFWVIVSQWWIYTVFDILDCQKLTFASCNIILHLRKTFDVIFRTSHKRRQRKAIALHPNEPSDDLYNSCSRRGVLDLRWWDPCILKDVIGVEPDLRWKVRYTLSVVAQNWSIGMSTNEKSFAGRIKEFNCLHVDVS